MKTPALSMGLGLLCAIVAGCGQPPGPPDTAEADGGDQRSDASSIDAATGCDQSGPSRDIDLLFVVGNGERGAATQMALFNGLELFFERLRCELGGPPNLHVGVVSSNLGAGGFDVPRCQGDGDGAVLQSVSRIAGCAAPTASFITDIDDGDGRSKNFTGPIDDALECIAALGDNGCTFEQPLAAAIEATDGVTNPGFVRPEAVLAIVIVGGGDDCSAASDQLFDPAAAATLGPLSPFRCFEQGLECNPDDPRSVGEKLDCVPRVGSLVTEVADLAATLSSRKPDPTDVVIGYIGGIPTDITVTESNGQFALDSACPDPLDAAPAARLSAIPGATGALTCLPSPSNLAPIADAIVAAATAD